MRIDGFQKHIFWSYAENADLPEEVIAKQVILYGEFGDMILLTEKIKSGTIEKVLSSLDKSYRYKKRINFIQKVILGL